MEGVLTGEGGGERLYTYRYTVRHHQNDSYIKMGRDESHINVSLIVREKVTRPQLLKRKESRSRFKPRSLCLPA